MAFPYEVADKYSLEVLTGNLKDGILTVSVENDTWVLFSRKLVNHNVLEFVHNETIGKHNPEHFFLYKLTPYGEDYLKFFEL